MYILKKKVIFFFLTIFFLGLFKNFVYAEDSGIQECRDNNKSVQECPSYLQSKVSLLQGQAKTLSSQIAIMDGQINLTQAKIEANKREILDLTLDIDTTTKKISTLSDSLNKITNVLLNRIVATYEAGSVQPLEMFLSSRDASNLLARLNYLRIAQAHDKRLIYDVQQAKNDYTNQKDIYEAKKAKIESLKKQLEVYNGQLNQEKQSKQSLLAQTQGSEANYKRLLEEARKQLASIASFADSQGASLLNNQTSCDDWGCYYNQRDSRWGNSLINGQGDGCSGACSIARVGCLITSVAMIVSHIGNRDILPSDIAFSDSGNFSVATALLKKGVINVKGININRVTIASSLSPELIQSEPVIVGVYYGVFGTHFVVVKSYADGKYIMNDPFVEGGKDKVFTDYYSLGSVFSVDRVSM